MRSAKIGFLLLCMVLVLGLFGCDNKKKVESITQVVTQADLESFRDYPNLKTLDASGSTCYSALMQFAQANPQVDVTYTVPFGSIQVSNKTTTLTLVGQDGSFEDLQKNLSYLPELSSLNLSHTQLTRQQLDILASANPKLTLRYSLEILGTEYTPDAQSVDLSAMEPEQLEAVVKQLELLPELISLELMDAKGTSRLSMTDVRLLMDALPEVKLNYQFDLFGQTLSIDTEAVEYVEVAIGNQGETALRQALDIMPNCTRFLLDECGIDSPILAAIREDYPNAGIVWRIHFGKYNVLTDVEMIKAVYNVFDHTVAELKYCNDVKYIDMGHNDSLTDISFMGYMPKLEIVIISGSAVSDISCFAGNKNLEFLEMAYCSFLTDLSPLKDCENLHFLNVGYTPVSNLEPLDNLNLERFVCIRSKVPHEEQELFKTFHPDCWTRFSGEDPYSLGWRYEDIGITFSPFYLKMRDIFGYK